MGGGNDNDAAGPVEMTFWVRRALGVELELTVLFDDPTVRSLTAHALLVKRMPTIRCDNLALSGWRIPRITGATV
jgi:hypothetical protein